MCIRARERKREGVGEIKQAGKGERERTYREIERERAKRRLESEKEKRQE